MKFSELLEKIIVFWIIEIDFGKFMCESVVV